MSRLPKMSIKEEVEPCELHEVIRCAVCREQSQEKAQRELKRSISHNAVNNLRNRKSYSNLQRRYSQGSIYSTASTDFKVDPASELPSDEDISSKMGILWELLPDETKTAYIRHTVLTKTSGKRDSENTYSDRLKYSHHESPLQSRSSMGKKEQLLKLLVDQLYEEVFDIRDEPTKYAPEQSINMNRLMRADEPMTQAHSPLEEIKLWRDSQIISEKIEELNGLIKRFQQFSPVQTPTKEDNTKVFNPSQQVKQVDRSKLIFPPKGEKKEGFLTSMAKKFARKWKHKKRPAALSLYREPNPDIRYVMRSPVSTNNRPCS
ncbi:hypothetical protein KAFR_0D04710 [Kazachstania africana CBS 2517]|uniref:Uncharacterized protein n=1 Tax=Kazachstania africana (strain ATCC 22294 / BCRC 22015 / CBS 2517 / CECT 1963 / NBRC 1671 / NRRL Y-8276) TaxID=1071382 RepID=H2AUR9_KAZAF|nr:hypothetical protein KAFR_0D04710 [Kazachstania africana CBS 2517]CCF58119.1 hypothetical protein KAFR_0D04710 [Kazachstania africana CBS 2517]